MITTNQLLAFTLASAIIVVVPGPSVLFTIGRALSVGRRDALLTVLGNAVGVYLQVVAVAFGIGAVVERSVAVFTAIKLVGAGYLIYLGVQAIRHRRSMAADNGVVATPARALRVLRDGLVVGAANPKSIVFLAAVLPQFVDRGAGQVPVQMLLLGVIFSVTALVLDSCWAFLASTARSWFVRSPRRLELVGGTGGLVMIGLGAGLVISGRKD
ncbi:MAG: LysE family translocator [Pseudonocardiaceae bacterium]|nr:LysE family translocator [Pseudonocardiaceae bacterium]